MGSKSSKTTNVKMRVLTLGIEAQGKTTFHKQMKLLFNGSFSDEEKQLFSRTMSQSITVGLQRVCDHAEEHKIELSRKAKKVSEWILDQNAHVLEINDEVATKCRILWECPKFQDALKSLGKFEYSESLEYGMGHLNRFLSTNWQLTNEDILIARQRTTGLSFTNFNAYKTDFTMVDVGGDAVERRKWVHAEREDYSAIIFFCSLDDFDAPCASNFKGTKLEESLSVWEDVMMHQVEPVRPIIVFFNKKDRFQEKIKHVSARKYIKTYKGEDGDYKAIVRHIADLFKQRIKKSPIPRSGVYMKTTNMTDSQTMHYLFKSFYDFMIRRSLEESGVQQKRSKTSSSSGKGGESKKRSGSSARSSSPASSPSTPKRSKRSTLSKSAVESEGAASSTSWKSEHSSDES